jgi:hypothetical protein
MMERSRRPRSCTICTDSFASYDYKGRGRRTKIVVPCGHCFHQECIDAWLAERGHLNVSCPGCNYRIERLIPCFCWEADSWEDRRNDDENDDVIYVREKWFVPWISILIVLLDAFVVLNILKDNPRQLYALEILALLTVAVAMTPTLLYVSYHALPEGMEDTSKYVEHFFSVLGIYALINVSFITVRLVSFPFPLAVMDGI